MRKIAVISIPTTLMSAGWPVFVNTTPVGEVADEVIPIIRPGDEAMTCAQIKTEGEELHLALNAALDRMDRPGELYQARKCG